MKDPLITLITVSANDFPGLELTVSSVSKQRFKNFDFILVVSGYTNEQISLIKEKLKFHNLKIIFDEGTGIYDAMNQGLHNCKTSHALFLNGGDELLNECSIDIVHEKIMQLKGDYNIAFSTYQKFADISFIRKALHKNRFFDWRFFPPPHQGFVARVNKGNLFKKGLGVGADTHWITEQIIRHDCVYFSDIAIANFYLGGISNNASSPPAFEFSNTFVTKLLKYLVYKMLGGRNYYIIISALAGYEMVRMKKDGNKCRIQ